MITTTQCFLILGRLHLLGSPWNEVSLEALEWSICVAAWPFYVIVFKRLVQLFNIIQDYFPIRDSKRLLECVKKCFLKEGNLPHYQNSWFFRTSANSNKMSGPLHIRINGCILY